MAKTMSGSSSMIRILAILTPYFVQNSAAHCGHGLPNFSTQSRRPPLPFLFLFATLRVKVRVGDPSTSLRAGFAVDPRRLDAEDDHLLGQHAQGCAQGERVGKPRGVARQRRRLDAPYSTCPHHGAPPRL